MIHFIRNLASSWYMKGFLFLIAVTFVSFFGLSEYRGCNPDQAAIVEGRTITLNALKKQYRFTLEQWSKSGLVGKDKITTPMKKMLLQGTLQRMINTQLIAEEAKRSGIAVGNEEILDLIRQQFGLKPGQKLDRQTYKRYTRYIQQRLGLSIRQFENIQREEAISKRYLKASKALFYLPDSEIKESYIDKNLKVNLNFSEISEKMLAKKNFTANEKEIKEYWRQHKNEFKTAEQRQFAYVSFTLNEKNNPNNANNEEERQLLVAKREKDKAVALEKAKQFVKEAKAAKDIVKLAKKKNYKLTSIASLKKGAKIDDQDSFQLVRQAFQLGKNEISQVLEGWSGTIHVVQLQNISPPQEMTFSQAKEEIEQRLEDIFINKQKLAQANKILQQLAKSDNPANRAKTLGLEIKETGLFSRSANDYIPKLGKSAETMNLAFNLSKKNPFPAQAVQVGEKAIVYWLKDKQQANMKEFAKMEKELQATAQQEMEQKILQSWLNNQRELKKNKISIFPANLAKTFPQLVGREDNV